MRITRREGLALGAAAAAGLALPARAASKAVVGALRLGSHAPSFVAMERGYFEAAGLAAELRFFDAAQPMAVAIASGDVDFGVTAITGGLVSLADKGAVKVIGGALSEEKGIEGQIILASNDAYDRGMTDPAKLARARFGMTTAGSSFQYMGARIAEAGGFEMTFVPLQKVGAVIGALTSGQIDAWSIVPNVGKSLVAAGGAKQIGLVADFLPDYQVTTVFTSARTAADDPERAKAFLDGFSRGAADYNAALVDRTAGDAARDEMVALIARYVAEGQDVAKAAPGILAGAMRINEGAAMHVASLKDQLAWFKSERLIDDGIAFETVVDTSFVRAI